MNLPGGWRLLLLDRSEVEAVVQAHVMVDGYVPESAATKQTTMAKLRGIAERAGWDYSIYERVRDRARAAGLARTPPQ
jgi:hypothetical protein